MTRPARSLFLWVPTVISKTGPEPTWPCHWAQCLLQEPEQHCTIPSQLCSGPLIQSLPLWLRPHLPPAPGQAGCSSHPLDLSSWCLLRVAFHIPYLGPSMHTYAQTKDPCDCLASPYCSGNTRAVLGCANHLCPQKWSPLSAMSQLHPSPNSRAPPDRASVNICSTDSAGIWPVLQHLP